MKIMKNEKAQAMTEFVIIAPLIAAALLGAYMLAKTAVLRIRLAAVENGVVIYSASTGKPDFETETAKLAEMNNISNEFIGVSAGAAGRGSMNIFNSETLKNMTGGPEITLKAAANRGTWMESIVSSKIHGPPCGTMKMGVSSIIGREELRGYYEESAE